MYSSSFLTLLLCCWEEFNSRCISTPFVPGQKKKFHLMLTHLNKTTAINWMLMSLQNLLCWKYTLKHSEIMRCDLWKQIGLDEFQEILSSKGLKKILYLLPKRSQWRELSSSQRPPHLSSSLWSSFWIF